MPTPNTHSAPNPTGALAGTADSTSAGELGDLFGGLIEFGRDGVSALMRSSNVIIEGYQDLTWACIDVARASVTDGLSGTRALMSCTSSRELAALQGELVLGGLETLAAESRRFGDLSARMIERTLAPLAARADVTAEAVAEPFGT